MFLAIQLGKLLRNQQVSGSSPLAGSNRLNNLQGFSGIGNCGCVGTMWANRPLKASSSPQEPAPRGNIVNARDRRHRRAALAGVAALSTASGLHPSSHRPRSRRTPSATLRLSPGTSRHCRSGGIPRLRGQRCETPCSRSGCVQHRVTNHPTTGLPVPDNPPRVSVRHRRSLPATPGRERLAPRSGQPQPLAGQLRLVDQLPFGRPQPQFPPPRSGPRTPASAAPATAPPRARRRPPPTFARTAPAALAAADSDSRSSPSSPHPSAAPTRRSTASASPHLRRARRRARTRRSAPSTRPPATSACRWSPCISCPGREQTRRRSRA